MNSLKIGVDVGENDAEPRKFVESALLAESKGFDSCWFGDHFMPWIHTGRQAPFAWALMASSFERTHRISLGPDVTCPIGGRYHPAIIAQAAATLDNLYPGRFMLGVGSGEAVNEAGFFQGRQSWPRWKERTERAGEAVTLIRELWSHDDYFTFNGKYFPMKDVLLYTKPKTKIPIYFATIGPKSAAYAARFGDHLITWSPASKCKDVIFPRFDDEARAIGRDLSRVEKMVLVHFAIGEEELRAKKLRAGFIKNAATFDEPDPRRIDALGMSLDDELFREHYPLCGVVDDLIHVAEAYVTAGATHIVFCTGASPDLINSIGDKVLPKLR